MLHPVNSGDSERPFPGFLETVVGFMGQWQGNKLDYSKGNQYLETPTVFYRLSVPGKDI